TPPAPAAPLEHPATPPQAPIELPAPQPRPNRARHRQQPVPQPASPPLALRRPRRNVQPPREWWVVQHEPVPAESSDEEQDQPELSQMLNQSLLILALKQFNLL
ncbi:hypothetical protein H0H93_002632, partial [Arthromyces matolae]